MIKRPSLYICVGLPGVGKTTYINKLAHEGVEVLSTDALIEEIASQEGQTYNEVFKEAIKKVEPIFWDNVRDAFSYGESILIDRTNLSVKSRKRFLDMAPNDYCKIALRFHCSYKTLMERLENRPGKVIPKFVLDDMQQRFEPPSIQEGFDRIEFIETD